jgi:hypothetical protein
MTRFAWLQSRQQTLVVTGLVATIAVVAAITGVQLSHLYHSLVSPCQGECDAAIAQFTSHDNFLQGALLFLMRIWPALLGVFLGAPLLAREFETGAFRLAWTQSVSRSRWVLTKLAVGGLATFVFAGAMALTVTWWFTSIDAVNDGKFGVFDARDLAPIAYALFAFAVGALLGALFRRPLPAMAATIAAVAAVRIVVQQWVRPNLIPPLHMTTSLLSAESFGFLRTGNNVDLVARNVGVPHAWVQSTQLINSATGHASTAGERWAFINQHCAAIAHPLTAPPIGGTPMKPGNPQAFEACRNQAANYFHLAVTYQPNSRYWPFQWMEAGIFVALALVCAGVCYWWVTRRS